MSVVFDEELDLFHLETAHTSYVIGLSDHRTYVGHAYYGKKVRRQDLRYLLRDREYPFAPSENNRERCAFYDSFPFEYSGNGVGDYRESCISVRTAAGQSAVMPTYVSYEITKVKPVLSGLPSTFDRDRQTQTLIIHCKDEVLNLNIDLYYTVFEENDMITRSVHICNQDEKPIYLTKVLSACVDMDDNDYELLTLYGSWARERQMERRKISHGKMSVGSVRGKSSHQEHPFMAWMQKNTTQTSGEIYAMHFVYSGNFLAQMEKNEFDSLRAVMGIHPADFTWKLERGEAFDTPEVVLTYSAEGIGRMTRNFHDFYRNHLIRSKYRNQKRPVLINNWEATYFDFNTDKLLDIARTAAEHGIEMLVMDDGWFGHRNDDNSSLGDWVVNEDKIVGGLKHLVDEVNALGMKFGIWVEPEMISPDSNLYREHPDWALAVENRTGSLARNQYVLDLSRKEVRDYIYDMIYKILSSANIEYVKWDMNRQLTDVGSIAIPSDRQGELFHRYVLGVYEMQERLVHDFPDLLLENCSGGGARFDPGMLYYSPQIWCSDNTDAIDRLSIQEGTALIYPLSTMGAHVSDCPNHTVGRVTPFQTRADVALSGTFGYELDITKIAPQEQAQISEQVALYHKYNELVREGDYYRLASYQENHLYDCYMVVSKDKREALVTFVNVHARPNYKSKKICLQGLEPEMDYYVEGAEDAVYGGDLLMNAGFLFPSNPGDNRSYLYHFLVTDQVR